MVDNTKHVNVFQGCGEIDLPKPEGLAASWYFIKGLSGNTHPGAVLPFGKYSCCLYSGGYPTGYGVNCVNTGFKVDKLLNKLVFRGMSHFQHSGTGAIDEYYNYAVTSPFYGEVFSAEKAFAAREVLEEKAEPGYYSVKIPDAFCEATTSKNAVKHRYTFSKSNGRLAVDFKNNGLYDGRKMRRPSSGTIRRVADDELAAEMLLSGVKIYFSVVCKGSGVKSVLWNKNGVVSGDSVTFSEPVDEPAGGLFMLKNGENEQAEIMLATSFISAKAAHDSLVSEAGSFDELRAAAHESWAQALSVIEIDTDDEREKEIFYSNMYHTLVKPADFGTDSFIENWGDSSSVLELSTMWDIYKTQLPFIFTFYKDMSQKLLASFLRYGQLIGLLPHTFIMSNDFLNHSKQARALAVHSVADAMNRDVEANYKALLDVMLKNLQLPEYADFFTAKGCEKTTHTLDMAEACGAAADVAQKNGKTKTVDLLTRYSRDFVKAFDKSTGLLRTDAEYYEGNLWNYSFRPLRHMKERIALCGDDTFLKYLDRFFGFTDASDNSTRFEGFNNESDMESPYAYCYTSRRDRLCEIIDAANKYMFTTGRGGIPGNNDSGGLSSCYIWNVLGVFPVSGQDLMLIGTPRYNKTVLHLANGNCFTVRREGKGIYVKAALLDGAPLDSFSFAASRMMRGGELVLEMSETAV